MESGLVEGEIGVVKVDRTPNHEFSVVGRLGASSMNSPKTAVVTGAAGGIGRSLARLLHDQGYRLVLADRDTGALKVVSEELSALAVETDVATPASMRLLAETAGSCDLLCLNAGVVSESPGAPWDSPPEEWNRVFGVNLGGVVNGLRSFVPLMADNPERSAILITASLAGVLTWPGGGPYGASKHAVVALAEQAALELAAENITVTVSCPALVRTGMSEVGEDPDVIAARALDAVERGSFSVIAEGWDDSIRERTERLLSGAQPSIPQPDRA